MDRVWDAILILLFNSAGTIGIITGVMTCAGLWGIFLKCGMPSYYALIPCFKYHALSQCAGREPEGRVLFTANALSIFSSLIYLFVPEGGAAYMLLSSAILVISLVELVYLIRVFFGLFEVFGVRKSWLFLCFIFELALVLLGWSDKRQPKWKAQDYRQHSASLSGASAKVMENGLTVNLEERTVTEFFKKKYLLRDIHMYVKPGSMVLLLGGSGAGKTTFLNAVNGYERAKAKISLNGADVYAQYKKMQYEIGFVPQQDLMRGGDTVLYTLSDAALLRLPVDMPNAKRKERVAEVMQLFGLEPVAGNLVEKLSGGQRKRLSIAMEFISNPSLFILDEPDSGLDGVMARELMEQLRKIADQGKIVIVITHTPDRVIDLFDDVIVLAKDANRTGRLAYYGSIEDARRFFDRERMEQVVMCINREEEGGEGRADEFITKFAEVQHV